MIRREQTPTVVTAEAKSNSNDNENPESTESGRDSTRMYEERRYTQRQTGEDRDDTEGKHQHWKERSTTKDGTENGIDLLRRPEKDAKADNRSDGRSAVVGVEPLTSIIQLDIDDGVLWAEREQPLLVVETATDPDGAATLKGPLGGGYTLQCIDSEIVLLPKYGRLTRPVRLKTVIDPAANESPRSTLNSRAQPRASSEVV